jgi:hypothetical protein
MVGGETSSFVFQARSVFKSRTTIRAPLIALSLMDYLEETLQLLWGPQHTTPYLAHAFATRCIDPPIPEVALLSSSSSSSSSAPAARGSH